MSEQKTPIVQDTQIQAIDPVSFIGQAIQSGASVETMERLLAMRKELKEESAKEAYYQALAAFQSDCPVIKKDKEVFNKDKKSVRYRYAPLDSIINQVKPILQKHGLSYTFQAVPTETQVKICCTAFHVAGHAEDSCFTVQIDPTAFMNDAQKTGSASTFAKRYAFCNVFGISTGDEDDDGQGAGRNGMDEGQMYRKFSWQMKVTMDNIDTVLAIKHALANEEWDVAAEAWGEICSDMEIYSQLSVAPSKGGCFDFEESKKMKSEPFREALTKYREGLKTHEV